MFVTNFVLYSLIECQKLGVLDFDESYIQESVEVLNQFQDKRYDKGIPIYGFWYQKKIDGNQIQSPYNILKAKTYLQSLPKFLQKRIWKKYGISAKFIDIFIYVFRTPADNDDTGVNLVLGNLLRENKDKYPNINSQWQKDNVDYYELYELIKKYACRPFSTDFNENTIDPRTYYVISDFLDQTVQNAKQYGKKPSRILFTTWITSIEDQTLDVNTMPFSVNNVDFTVCANSLYGLLTLIQNLQHNELVDMRLFYDQTIKQMITDTVDLLVWAIENNIVNKRPDLSLTYYPSIYNFYWFVARLGNYLNSQEKNIKQKEVKYVQQQLNSILKTTFTQQLLELAKEDKQENIYWEEFLGNYPRGIKHSDRVFSTAMALNSLLEIYTTKYIGRQKQYKLQYIPDTPRQIQAIIKNSVQFLSKLMVDPQTPLQNTFFSGSIKGGLDLSFWYPANSIYVQDKNKKILDHIDPTKYSNIILPFELLKNYPKGSSFIDGQSGYIDKKEYEKQVNNQTWFGMHTPQKFYGYNQNLDPFPYWTSDSITLSFSMLVFSRYINIKDN